MTLFEEMLKNAKLAGYTVLIPEKPTSYFYFTDGQRIGYAQADRLRGPLFLHSAQALQVRRDRIRRPRHGRSTQLPPSMGHE